MRSKKFLSVCVVCAVVAAATAGCSLLDSLQGSSSSSSVSTSESESTSTSSSSSQSQSSSQPASSSQSSSSQASSSESSSASESSSSSSSTSSSSSSQAQTLTWNGNYVSSEGAASQINLTISGQTSSEIVFEFYLKGIDYSGTAKINSNTPSVATYTDPNNSGYSLSFQLSDSGITVTESGSFPDANCSFAGSFAAK